jgi:hypothetical protein
LKENGEGRRDLVCHANGGRGALGEFPVEDIFFKKKEGGGSAVRTPAAPAAAAEWASQHHRKRNLSKIKKIE